MWPTRRVSRAAVAGHVGVDVHATQATGYFVIRNFYGTGEALVTDSGGLWTA